MLLSPPSEALEVANGAGDAHSEREVAMDQCDDKVVLNCVAD